MGIWIFVLKNLLIDFFLRREWTLLFYNNYLCTIFHDKWISNRKLIDNDIIKF